MVMSLLKPDTCSLELLEAVIAERQGGVNAAFFNDIADEWYDRVAGYAEHAGSPDLVPRWPQIEPRKNSFLNLYGSARDGSVQKMVIARMRDEHDLMYCPACGEPGRPNTLDHYLPKGRYPHFCITPLNLFPMCDACQKHKGEKTGDANSPRFFIHPYYDVFIAQQVIGLRMEPPYDAPGFSLSSRENLTDEQRRLVDSHVRELAIEQRYIYFFRGQHRRLLRIVKGLRDGGQDVRTNLTAFKDGVESSGANVWDRVFYVAVLEDEGMMDYLEHAQFPPYL